jgi:Dimethyladenosine transferase (rRNA methylation)
MVERKEWEIRAEKAAEKLNLKWYRNADGYSDGDVEDDILKYIAENKPEDYDRVIEEHYNWPVFYHLTHIRKNLLNWYPFQRDASVLEIGCGCGAITSLLCDKCRKVTAVELSKRRATAARLRCMEKDNLEVIVGNLNDMCFDEKFDYITLIGVLEYQGTFTESDNPYKDFLIKIKSLLKEDGKLLIAIENKYGAKYWCGAVEDHSGIPFDGLNQYKMSGGKMRTFAKEELEELLKESGYKKLYFYFPMPDYKLPVVVYSEKHMPQNEYMDNMLPYYIPTNQTLLADEMGLYKDIIENDVFAFMANSFLVECSDSVINSEEEERVTFALLNSNRKSKYRIGTLIKDSGIVMKFALESNGVAHQHLNMVMQNMERMERRGLGIIPHRIECDRLVTNFMALPTLEDVLRNAAVKKDKEQIWKIWDMLLEQIEMTSDMADEKECIIYHLELDEYRENNTYGKILKKGYLDMIPRNCFIKDGQYLWFDQEWLMDNLPSKFVLLRAMLITYDRVSELLDVIPREELVEHYDLYECLKVIDSFTALFEGIVQDTTSTEYYINSGSHDIYIRNVKKLLSK